MKPPEEYLTKNMQSLYGECIRAIKQSQKEVIDSILFLDNPYPLTDVINLLKFGTEYLLNNKSYDGHNYEELENAVSRADEIIQDINNLLNQIK